MCVFVDCIELLHYGIVLAERVSFHADFFVCFCTLRSITFTMLGIIVIGLRNNSILCLSISIKLSCELYYAKQIALKCSKC